METSLFETETKEIVSIDTIQSMIIRLTNRPPAMLASNLAELYETETRIINQAVDRNKERFPDDFYFQLNDDETKILRSQNVMSQKARTANPYMFTREGANMLSAVLHSDVAIQRSVQIMRAFSKLESGIMPIGISNIVADHVEATLRVAKIFGLEGNQAFLSTNNAVKQVTGVDCMALLNVSGLVKEDKIQYFTPTVLGKQIGISPIKFNQKLKEIGFQKTARDGKDKLIWIATEKGKRFCEMIDTGKKHNTGAPVMQIKWSETVLDFIKE
jgi:hypothetical protein